MPQIHVTNPAYRSESNYDAPRNVVVSLPPESGQQQQLLDVSCEYLVYLDLVYVYI